jgi:hypothetical protein
MLENYIIGKKMLLIKSKVKLALYEALETCRVARCRGFHIF